MGRKGVSKRKPKRSRPISNADIGGSSNARSGERSMVQSLVKDKDTSLIRANTYPYAGLNKKNRKGK